MSKRVVEQIVKKYSVMYYIKLLFKEGSWNKPEDMKVFLNRLKVINFIYLVCGTTAFLLWWFAKPFKELHFGVGKNAWVLLLIGISSLYGLANGILGYSYWKIYEKNWKKTGCYGKISRSRKFIKGIIIFINIPWMVLFFLVAKILQQNDMIILFENGEDLILSMCIAIGIGPIIGIILLHLCKALIFPSMPVKTYAYLLVFLCVACAGVCQNLALKILLKFTYNKDMGKVKRTHIKMQDKLCNIILLIAWIVNFVFGLIEISSVSMKYLAEGLLYTTALITAWITLRDRIQ